MAVQQECGSQAEVHKSNPGDNTYLSLFKVMYFHECLLAIPIANDEEKNRDETRKQKKVHILKKPVFSSETANGFKTVMMMSPEL